MLVAGVSRRQSMALDKPVLLGSDTSPHSVNLDHGRRDSGNDSTSQRTIRADDGLAERPHRKLIFAFVIRVDAYASTRPQSAPRGPTCRISRHRDTDRSTSRFEIVPSGARNAEHLITYRREGVCQKYESVL